ncbi:amino acid transporter [Colletotrichum sojae]|uniref:Amino acid transporter n=1 Tax=Colletotrichum sojae TaxID=2175907 RepID=A0A8H6IQC3_9PEZI|nr:amino acid transporter [Colletotrichum sojae]
MCFSIAAYAYVGVEIIAVSAIEARWRSPSQSSSATSQAQEPDIDGVRRSARNAVKFAAVLAPIAIGFAYTLSGLLASINLERCHYELSRLSWINNTEVDCRHNKYTGRDQDKKNSPSPFVIIAKAYDEDYLKTSLAEAFNVFILFTALTSTNTSLYVASRTLFGLTRNIDGSGIVSKSLSWFGKTDENRVPLRTMLLSALAFFWVPFVQQANGGFENGSSVGKFFEVLAQLGAVSVAIVWACQCLAYIRFHHCIPKHRKYLTGEGIDLARERKQGSVNYPFRSHLQPVLAHVALGGCLVVLVICNGAFLWKDFHPIPFLSGYLAVRMIAMLIRFQDES